MARAAPFGGRLPLRSALGEFEAEMSARAAPKARNAALGAIFRGAGGYTLDTARDTAVVALRAGGRLARRRGVTPLARRHRRGELHARRRREGRRRQW